MTVQADVKVGDLFVGWGKTWRVVNVVNGTAKSVNVDKESNTVVLPLKQYREMERA